MKVCKRCIAHEGFPHVDIDSSGLCNYCREYPGRSRSRKEKAAYRKKFSKLARDLKGKTDYDVLLCYSGGKDSTYTLFLLSRVYKLKVLAYTVDNGFVPSRTYENIRNVCESLDVDHVLFKPRFGLLRKIFRAGLLKRCQYASKTLERASTVCTYCTGIVKYSALKLAVEKGIPMVAFGWSPGQAPTSSSIMRLNPAMIKSMQSVLFGPMRKIVKSDMSAYMLPESFFNSVNDPPVLVHPLGFSDYNEKAILGRIQKFGWVKPKDTEMNATNCLLNPIADLAHMKKHGFHPYVLEIAALVREGYMPRREGLKHCPVKKDQKVIKFLSKRLGLKRGDI